jgi:Tfp pilus assembly protein PilF
VLLANDYRYIVASLQHRAGRTADARATYRDVLANDLGYYMAHVRLADLSVAAEDWPVAIQERRTALELASSDPTTKLDLGVTLARAGNMVEADSVLGSAAEAAPRDSRVSYYRGLVSLSLNDAASARAHFDRFLRMAPSRYGQQIADAKRRLQGLP